MEKDPFNFHDPNASRQMNLGMWRVKMRRKRRADAAKREGGTGTDWDMSEGSICPTVA